MCGGGKERCGDEPDTGGGERLEAGDLCFEIGASEDERELIQRKGEAIGDVAERQVGIGECGEEAGLESH